jgi:hypothetical protein
MNYLDGDIDSDHTICDHKDDIICGNVIPDRHTFILQVYIYILLFIGYFFLYSHITFLDTLITELSDTKDSVEASVEAIKWGLHEDLRDTDDSDGSDETIIHSNL